MKILIVTVCLSITIGLVKGDLRSVPRTNLEEIKEEKVSNSFTSDYPEEEEAEAIPVLHFCCQRHHFYDMMNRTCSPSDDTLEPYFHTQDGHLINNEVMKFINVTRINFCESFFVPGSKFQILPNDRMMIKLTDMQALIESEMYCLLWVKQNNTFEMSALVCFPEETVETSLFKKIVYIYLLPISMGISSLFLAVTFFIYCLVKELQDLLGKSLMCSMASLFMSKVFGIVAKVFTYKLTMDQCVVVALLMHLGFLHAFFWLNVISFILFFSICFQGKFNNYSRKKCFIISCHYAFGVPLIIMTLILIHDFTSHFDNFVVPKPGFGVGSCGFTNRGAQVVYFYAPISLLLGINLVLFCASACRLFILSKQSSAFVFQFNHYLKLLVLMGIPWIFEVLSFFFGQDDELSVATFIWLAFDVFNALQGVIIFIVFACRRTVFARVSESLCGSTYARRKYPDVFLQHANEGTQDGLTQDLRMTEADKRILADSNESE